MELSKEKLIDYYASIFTDRDFVPKLSLNQFRKDSEQGFKSFVVSISNYETDSLVELHLGTRINSIEGFVSRYIQMLPEFGEDVMTIMTSMARVQGIVFKRFSISDSDTLQQSYDEIEEFVSNIGIGKLDEWQDMKLLNKVYNNDPYDLSLIYNPFNKAIRGLVLARFSANPNYHQLVEKYRYFLEYKKYPPNDLEAFENLVKVLDFVNPN